MTDEERFAALEARCHKLEQCIVGQQGLLTLAGAALRQHQAFFERLVKQVPVQAPAPPQTAVN